MTEKEKIEIFDFTEQCCKILSENQEKLNEKLENIQSRLDEIENNIYSINLEIQT